MIDLAQGYYQVFIAKFHEYRAAFQKCFGFSMFYVLLFGQCNATATLQRLMNKILLANLDVF